MSTRSRRSAGGDAGALNPVMIHLIPLERLKKELESRGLSTVGKKEVLADRLYDAVVGNTPVEAVVTPSPKAKPPPRRKSQPEKKVVKEEVEEEEPVVEEQPPVEKTPPQKKAATKRNRTKVKQEPVDPDEPVEPSPTVAKRARVKREPLSPSPERERHVPSTSSPAKRAKPVPEPVEEAASEVKTEPEPEKQPEPKPVSPKKASPQKSPQKSPHKPADVQEVVPPSPKKTRTKSHTDIDDDVPLLSLLGPPPSKKPTKPLIVVKKETVVKEEVVEDAPVCSSAAEQPVHQHGTRRSTAMRQAQSQDTPKQKEKMNLLQNSKLLSDADCDTSEDYVPPPRKESVSHLKHPEAKSQKHPSKEERKKSVTGGVPPKSSKPVKTEPEKPKPRPVEQRKTIAEMWAEKISLMKKDKEAAEAKKDEAPRTPTTGTPKPPGAKVVKPTVASKPLTAQSSGGFVLDDILTKQEEEALEAKRKKEREEHQQKAAEQRNREKMAEQRKKAAAEAAAKLAAHSSGSSSSVNSPANSTPKLHPYAIPQPLAPHPYSIPQSLPQPGQKTAAGVRIPPPPPPKKATSSGGNSAVNSPATASPGVLAGIPPPPPPKKATIPPPPPKHKKEPFVRPTVRPFPLESKETSSSAAGDNVNEAPAGVSMSGSSSEASNLVDSVTRALLSAMAQHGGEEQSMDSEDGAGPSQVPGENEEFEEYDPLGTSDFDVSAYVPSTIASRNQTLQGDQLDEDEEEEEEYVPSDYEGDGADESDDSEGEEGPSAEETQDLPETKKENEEEEERRAAAGKDEAISVENLLKNKRDLLSKASAVLLSMNKNDSTDGDGPQYVQMPCADDYEHEEHDRKTPEYHGEPVPSDDEDLFEIAAGIVKPKKKKEIVIEEEKLPSDETIEPDYYNADLHIKGAVEKNWQIEPENADGLALMWGGVRSNYGIRLPFRDVRNCDEEGESGEDKKEKLTNTKKIVFQVKITEFLPTKHLPFEEMDPHDIRVGFSLRSAPNNLGEFSNSYCITSLGKKATNNIFNDFGAAFHLNDVITASIDLEENTISYWKNEEFMGVAFTNISLPDGEAIFPHICIKNCNVAVNFGDFPGEDEDNKWTRNEEWRFFNSLGRGDLERSPKSPDSKAACTVIIMVGLPGVGKTTWVREYLREHPGEQWTVINSEGIMAAMKVNGVSRKRAHQGRWDMVMGLVGKSLQRSVLLAARRRRNYILDMTNTSRDARKRRLQLFEEFRRKCVIIMPSDEDMVDRQARQARHEGTAIMPPEAMLEMKAMISLPAQDLEPFEDIYFIEPNVNRVQDAIDQVARYNEEARPWFQKKYRRRRSQMIGLGDGVPRDNMQPRKFTQPLTVMPQLKVAVIPLDDPSNTGPSSYDSGPNSLGFAMVDNSPIPQNLHTPPVSRVDRTIPPPAVVTPTGSAKPLVRVTITDDTPQAHVPVPFNQPTGAPGQLPVEEEYRELDDDEIREVRESAKASSSNPMIAEAVMRAKLKVLLIKKKEKRAGSTKAAPVATPAPAVVATVASPVVASSSRSGTPIQVLGARTIPTIGAVNPITIDTAPRNSPSGSNPNSPIPLMSPAIARQSMPPALTAPYLASPVFPNPPAPFTYPTGSFGVPPPPVSYNLPLPGVVVPSLSVAPTSTFPAVPGFQQWSQPNNNGN